MASKTDVTHTQEPQQAPPPQPQPPTQPIPTASSVTAVSKEEFQTWYENQCLGSHKVISDKLYDDLRKYLSLRARKGEPEIDAELKNYSAGWKFKYKMYTLNGPEEGHIYRPDSKNPTEQRKVVPPRNWYDELMSKHEIKDKHDGQNKTIQRVAKESTNIPPRVVKAFVKMCQFCKERGSGFNKKQDIEMLKKIPEPVPQTKPTEIIAPATIATYHGLQPPATVAVAVPLPHQPQPTPQPTPAPTPAPAPAPNPAPAPHPNPHPDQATGHEVLDLANNMAARKRTNAGDSPLSKRSKVVEIEGAPQPDK